MVIGGSARNAAARALGLALRALLGLPDRLLRWLFRDPPSEAAGLRPDQWAIARLAAVAERLQPDRGPAADRAAMELLARMVSRPVRGVAAENLTLDGEGRSLSARLFRPSSGRSGLLVHFHGGGWVQGSVDSHSDACARFARESGLAVLSVEYRLAPEHPFPTQAEDALLAWRAVAADPGAFGAESGRVGVIGDSAGAQMAAVLCQDLKVAGEKQPACQVLIYPVTECGGKAASRRVFAHGYYLTRERMDRFEELFIPAGEAGNPRVSPLLAADLSGLAPAVVSVACADPLRDEGIAYARRLRQAAVPVTLDRMPLIHAWFNLTVSRSSRTAHRILAAHVNELLG